MSADNNVADPDWYEHPAPFASQPRARKPLSGWRRLWIVLSVILGIPAAASGWDANDSAYTYIRPNAEVAALTDQKFWNALWAQAKREQPYALEACIVRTVKMHDTGGGEYSIGCDRAGYYSFLFAALWGCVPGLVMWIVGKITRWVYRGFRSVPA